MLLQSAYTVYECYILGRKQISLLESHKGMEISLKPQLQTSRFFVLSFVSTDCQSTSLLFSFFQDGHKHFWSSVHEEHWVSCLLYWDGASAQQQKLHRNISVKIGHGKERATEDGIQRYEETLQRGVMNITRWATKQKKGLEWKKKMVFNTWLS